MADRKFGIELEVSRRLVNAANDKRAKSENWEALKSGLSAMLNDRAINRGWKIKTDTSCGGEIVSPPLGPNTGLRDVARVCAFAKKFAKSRGLPVVDGECGLHIHINATGMTPRQIGNLFVLVAMMEPFFFSMYDDRNMEYCAPLDINLKLAERFRDWFDVRDAWYRGSNNKKDSTHVYSSRFLDSMDPGDNYDGTRYHGFNIHCYFKINTVEFRYARGTFDINHIAGYHDICQALVRAAIDYDGRIKCPKWLLHSSMRHNMRDMIDNRTGRAKLLELHKIVGFSRRALSLIIGQAAKNGSNIFKKKVKQTFIASGNIVNFMFFDIREGTGYWGISARNGAWRRFNDRNKRTVVEISRDIPGLVANHNYKLGMDYVGSLSRVMGKAVGGNAVMWAQPEPGFLDNQ